MTKKKSKEFHSDEVNSVQHFFFSSYEQNQNIQSSLTQNEQNQNIQSHTQNEQNIQSISQIQTNRRIQIIKSPKDIRLKLKRGRDTQGIHLRALNNYMHHFQSHYQYKNYENYYPIAKKQVQNVIKKNSFTNPSLEKIFGGQIPTKESSQEQKKQFIINRMNAKVLELIYQKYLLDIVFKTARIEDKLTIMAYIQQYRSRLKNPQLCGKIECKRPNLKQKKSQSKKQKNTQLIKPQQQ